MRVMVTGGAGFIGSALCRYLVLERGWEVLNLDKLTYASDLRSLDTIDHLPNYQFIKADIADPLAVAAALHDFGPDAVMHLAAESHVDRSIDGPGTFINTNVVGTYHLLEAVAVYWRGLSPDDRERFRFHHISTDEVYGSLGPDDGLFTEQSPYRPNSPYAASKASSDHLVRAWCHTYGLPVVISNCSNNYGPFQFPEKFIPLMIINALRGRKLPVYGDGRNIRDWLHVDDHARALAMIVEQGRVGETYNVGGRNEARNIDMVRQIFDLVCELAEDVPITKFDDIVEFVTDRPGHDHRYAIDATKIETELGWKATHDIASGLRKTVQWYIDNRDWWQAILDHEYDLQRLGQG
ncbi:dTDP-glucose 4,6-dehydratase [Thalassospira xiamenensis]|uniref:dTDP-glucose 4,6-dehydratase n=1 Tax=Thalassospira xiamenensis TaxID=220697 RepID=UPI000DEDB474|nr:dTDP-glucose 4,6-dehydratase [Thalassospira xiamenensis]RCK33334.1 dTDP-glucose 4,6-dehydratase [Thalassospira xiamenensis]